MMSLCWNQTILGLHAGFYQLVSGRSWEDYLFYCFLKLDFLNEKVEILIPVSKGLYCLGCLCLQVSEAQLSVSKVQEFIGRILGYFSEQEATESQDGRWTSGN